MYLKKILRILQLICRFSVALFCISLIASCFAIKQPFVRPIKTEPSFVDTTTLKKHVDYFSITTHPRNFENLDNLNAAADYIHQHFSDLGIEVTEQSFEARGKTYRNISAHFGPKNQPTIVVGAHYDSCHETPGADDNASGVAGLLELARLLKENPPNRSIELVAYTLEEPPFFRTELMGSAVHAQSARAANRPIKLMLALEMIGYFKDEPDTQTYPLKILKTGYPSTGNYIGVIGRLSEGKETRKVMALMSGATDLPVYSMNAPSSLVQGLDFSDHRNYWANGYKALMITDTAFFRNQNYHELTDTADTLDYQRMAKVVQGVYAVVQNIN